MDEKIFDKRVNSSFKDTGLLEYLKGQLEHQLIAMNLFGRIVMQNVSL